MCYPFLKEVVKNKKFFKLKGGHRALFDCFLEF